MDSEVTEADDRPSDLFAGLIGRGSWQLRPLREWCRKIRRYETRTHTIQKPAT